MITVFSMIDIFTRPIPSLEQTGNYVKLKIVFSKVFNFWKRRCRYVCKNMLLLGNVRFVVRRKRTESKRNPRNESGGKLRLKTNKKIPQSAPRTGQRETIRGFDTQPLGKLQKPARIPGDYGPQGHQSTA